MFGTPPPRVIHFVHLLLYVSLTTAALGQQSSSPHPIDKSKKFDFSSYFQVRYTGIDNAPDLYALRRFKVMVFGHANPHLEYYVQGIFKDGNRSDTDGRPYLQEAWIRLTDLKRTNITIGQLKPPFGLERFTQDAKILTIDRTQATDHLVPNGSLGDSFSRDYGVQVDSRLAGERFSYAFGVFGGNGANEAFHGNGPLFAGRVSGVLFQSDPKGSRPSRVTLGGACSTRNARQLDFSSALPGTAALGYDQFSGRDTRSNLEAAADFGHASFRGEYFYAWFRPNRPEVTGVDATGFYVQTAYRFMPFLEGVLKYEGFDPVRSVADHADLRWTTVGLNWYLRGNRARVSTDYVFKREGKNGFPNDALLVQFQLFLR